MHGPWTCRNHTHPHLTPPLGPSAHPQDMAAVKPSLGRVFPGSSILFLCDMQEKFRHIAYFPQIVSVAARMLKVQVPPPSDLGSSYLLPQTGVQAPLPSDWGPGPSTLRPEVQHLLPSDWGSSTFYPQTRSPAPSTLRLGVQAPPWAQAFVPRLRHRWPGCWRCQSC